MYVLAFVSLPVITVLAVLIYKNMHACTLLDWHAKILEDVKQKSQSYCKKQQLDSWHVIIALICIIWCSMSLKQTKSVKLSYFNSCLSPKCPDHDPHNLP